MFKYIYVLISLFFLISCSQERYIVEKQDNQKLKTTINEAIIDMSNQLAKNNILQKNKGSIIITTFVDLNNLKKTTNLGRLLSESLINELFIRGFNINDFRGENRIVINKQGEFYISRDIKNIKSEVPNTYVLIGTYTKVDNKMLLNVRIIDNKSGKVVSSARTILFYDDCSVLNICQDTFRKIKIVGNKLETKRKEIKKIIF